MIHGVMDKKLDRHIYLLRKKTELAFRRLLFYPNKCGPSNPIRRYIGVPYWKMYQIIEMQFTSDMTWDNYGLMWTVGHVVPQWVFDYTNPNELLLSWNWINLMPLKPRFNKILSGAMQWSLAELYRREEIYSDNKILQQLISRCIREIQQHYPMYDNAFYTHQSRSLLEL